MIVNNDQQYCEQAFKSVQGVGLGLRACHYQYILTHQPSINWFEVLTDNYLMEGGPALFYLEKICERYPVTLHGVGMSLGSTDDINWDYLKKIKLLAEKIKPVFISDHLSWSSINGNYFPDLLPLPYTEEAINHVVMRIKMIQDFLNQKILIENVSSYLTYTFSEMSEWEFLAEIAKRAQCGILLDINNVYVSSVNQNFDPEIYLDALSPKNIFQFHLAGYTDLGTHLFDMHGAPVHSKVWDLYEYALKRFGALPTIIEWDTDIPSFEILQKQAHIATKIMEKK